MADQAKTVNIRVQQKTDDLSNWNSANPVLLDGELAVVRDGNNVTFRVGDGQKAFKELSSAHSGHVDTQTLSVANLAFALRTQTRFLSVASNSSYAGPYGIVHGNYVSAMGSFQTVHGINAVGKKGENHAFVWNGDSSGVVNKDIYQSHGKGSFNINPVSGTAGLFIGERSLDEVIGDGTSRVYVGDAGGTQKCDLSVVRIGKDEYAELVAGDKAISNCLYIVSSDTVDAYGERVVNVAAATDVSDAVNLGQLQAAVDGRLKAYGINTLTNDLSINSTSSPGCVTTFKADGYLDFAGEGNGLKFHEGTFSYYHVGSGQQMERWDQLCAKQSLGDNQTFQTLPEYLSQEYSPRYRLAHGTWTKVGDGLSCRVEDRTITTLEVSSQSVPLSIRLPNRPRGFARDFMIRFEISSSNAPTMTYTGDVSGLTFASSPKDGVNVVSFLDTREV